MAGRNYGAIDEESSRATPSTTTSSSTSPSSSSLVVSRKSFALATIAVLAAALSVLGLSFLSTHNEERSELVSARGGAAVFQSLAETSVRTDKAHPYNRMINSPDRVKFINKEWTPAQTVNPPPVHPYHGGYRPAKVLHRDFEHEPYGNHLPWEKGPEGAQAKYAESLEDSKAYRYMVDKNGIVRKWETDLPLDRYNPNHIVVSSALLDKLSPLPPPSINAKDVAGALQKQQKDEVKKSFRSIFPHGMFHDTIVDSRTGAVSQISGVSQEEVDCPGGLFKCKDDSCVAHISYCPGCDVYPVPEHCSLIQPHKSGWRVSAGVRDGRREYTLSSGQSAVDVVCVSMESLVLLLLCCPFIRLVVFVRLVLDLEHIFVGGSRDVGCQGEAVTGGIFDSGLA
eukprot:766337-Hanusia_phi.AAC.1